MAETNAMIEEMKALNKQIAEMEQQRDDGAKKFFHRHLSDDLIFRRADGSVVGKVGKPEQRGFSAVAIASVTTANLLAG